MIFDFDADEMIMAKERYQKLLGYIERLKEPKKTIFKKRFLEGNDSDGDCSRDAHDYKKSLL